MSRLAQIGTAIGAIGIALIVYFLFIKQPAPPPPPPQQTYTQAGKSLAQFDDEIAQMALDQLGNLPGLSVRPTDAEVPIGTLFIPGRSLDLDEDACRVDPAPTAYRASAFPDFEVQNAVAASVGLSPEITRSLASVGAQINQANKVTIHFDGLKRQYLDDHKLAQLVRRADCIAALEDGPVWMIRGYFRGQRSFVLSATRAGKLDAKIAKIGDFDVSRNAGDSSIVLKDPTDFGFLQLYTQVELKPAASPPVQTAPPPPPRPTPPSLPDQDNGSRYARYHYRRTIPAPPSPMPTVSRSTAAVQTPTLVTVTAASILSRGRVYVQRDASDGSHADGNIVAALKMADFAVVPKVEAVPSAKMPVVAQVRYFNATDLPAATKALGVLRATFRDAQLRRIALPSPDGQLEVWLPRAH